MHNVLPSYFVRKVPMCKYKQVFRHEIGEIWQLRCSPHDAATLLTVHNSYDPVAQQCAMGVSIYKLPTVEVTACL